MYERAMTFTEYIGYYGLARSEGLVLRYLASAYKALRADRPRGHQTEELRDLIEWLGELVRQVDSSLLDEWEQLTNPEPATRRTTPGRGRPPSRSPPTRAPSGCWCATRCSAGWSWPRSAATTSWANWTARRLGRRGAGKRRWRPTTPSTRTSRPVRTRAGPTCCSSPSDADDWQVRQIFDDPEGDHDWGITRRGGPGRLRRGRTRSGARGRSGPQGLLLRPGSAHRARPCPVMRGGAGGR